MLRSRTTTLPPKDLVSPSTSTATASFIASAAGMAHTRRLLQRNGYGLADTHIAWPLRNRLDPEHQTRTLLQTVDDGWGELGLRRYEVHPRRQVRRATVAVDHDLVANVHLRQERLRHKEAHSDVLGRQERHDRPAGRHHFADPEVDFLNAARDRACKTPSLQARARRIEPGLRTAQRCLGVVEHLLRADRLLQQLLRTVVGDPGVGNSGLILGHHSPLQIGIEREKRRSHGDCITLAHEQRLHASRLVGAHEDKVGLDPTFKAARLHPLTKICISANGDAEPDRHSDRSEDPRPQAPHGASFPGLPVSTSRCARSKPSTSRGSILENSPSQSTATSNGATMSWGKRAGASLANAPSRTARSASARIMRSPRATTSR